MRRPNEREWIDLCYIARKHWKKSNIHLFKTFPSDISYFQAIFHIFYRQKNKKILWEIFFVKFSNFRIFKKWNANGKKRKNWSKLCYNMHWFTHPEHPSFNNVSLLSNKRTSEKSSKLFKQFFSEWYFYHWKLH